MTFQSKKLAETSNKSSQSLPEVTGLYVGSVFGNIFSRVRRFLAPAALSVIKTTGIDPKQI